MKRIICAVLVLMMVAASFVACSNDPKKTQAQTGAQQTQQAGTGAQNTQAATLPKDVDKWGRPLVDSNIPADKKFNGETVNFVMDSSRGTEFYVEAADGDIINDEVYERNLRVEDNLNIKLNFIAHSAYTDFASAMNTSVLTGTGDYDICAGYAYFFTSAIRSMPYANLIDIQEISSLDLSKPWWNQFYVNEVTFADQLYTVTGDLCISATSSAGCIFFNKRLADEHLKAFGGTNGLYDLVNNYQWTIDKFAEVVKDVYNDADGDGLPSEGDFYAFSSWWSGPIPCDAFQFGMDAPITRRDPETGEMKFVYDDGKMIQVVEKLWNLNNNSKGVLYNSEYYNNGEKRQMIIDKFRNGELIFYSYALESAQNFREMADDFGILPMPMFDEAQHAYYTSQEDTYSAVAILSDVEEVFQRGDLVGTTLEKLCEESYREVTPNYFEVVMKFRYLRTDSENKQDIAMYDYIVGGNRFNFGLVFSSAMDNPSFMLRHLIGRDNSTGFTSYWQTRETVIKFEYNGLINWFLDE